MNHTVAHYAPACFKQAKHHPAKNPITQHNLKQF